MILALVLLAAAAIGPEPFAPELSAKAVLFRGVLAADGTLYFFQKTAPAADADYRVFTSRRGRDGAWSPALRLDLGGDHSDLYPFPSADGRLLVFASYRPAPEGAPRNGHIWYATRVGDGWSAPRYAAPVNAPGHYHSALTLDARNTLRFRRTTPDWKSSTPMMARWTGDGWSEPERDPEAARWQGPRNGRYDWGTMPSPDGRWALVFTSEIDAATNRRLPAKTYIAHREGAGWSEPRLLPESINGLEPNFWTFTPDGQALLFTAAYSSFYRIAIADLLRL
ncbi:MAG: hypothetical protein SFV54_28450 [Bryobacteraceae bacterium]|nr:hypothetical protein [Bryobacteraceae bacterium]